MLNILLVSLELFPLVKVGGIADAVAALAKALAMRGHRVTVAIPRRDGVTSSAADNVALVVLDVDGYASGDLYGHDVMETAGETLRHGALASAVMTLVLERAQTGEPFDIVHVHDWPLAMIPYLLRERRAESPTTRSVLTIHNVAFQGIMRPEAIAYFGLDPAEHFREDRLFFHGHASMLKGGILGADALTTVSPTYARDLLTPEHGQLLDDLLRARRGVVHGILNGIDVDVWNPAIDQAIAARYDGATFIAGKAACKQALLAEVGLDDPDPSRPLFAYVGRLFDEKGADILAAALPRIVERGGTVIVAGTGDAASSDALRAAAARAAVEQEQGRGRHTAILGWVSEERVHQIFAAADALLVPSRIEPCGLVQMYAQRYGALPIACRTGGLIDTIVDVNAEPNAGTGFLFDAPPTADALIAAVDQVVVRYQSPLGLRDAAARAMGLLRDWGRPAMEYESVYLRARTL